MITINFYRQKDELSQNLIILIFATIRFCKYYISKLIINFYYLKKNRIKITYLPQILKVLFQSLILMSSRLKCCVAFMSTIILCSTGYMAYNIFLNHSKNQIQIFNRIRLYIFFAEHLITLAMLVFLLQLEQNQSLIKWMFQLSTINLLVFAGGQIYAVTHGGRLFGSYVIQTDFSDEDDPIYFFQLNFLTLYYQIMTNFVMFFIISGIGLIIIRYRVSQEQERYEFMIDNLHSQDYVQDPQNNHGQKKACSICLTDLQLQRVLKLPCQHYFHKQCIKDWLKRSQVCPLCRDDIQQSLSPNSPVFQRHNDLFNDIIPQSDNRQNNVVLPYSPPIPPPRVQINQNRNIQNPPESDRINQMVNPLPNNSPIKLIPILQNHKIQSRQVQHQNTKSQELNNQRDFYNSRRKLSYQDKCKLGYTFDEMQKQEQNKSMGNKNKVYQNLNQREHLNSLRNSRLLNLRNSNKTINQNLPKQRQLNINRQKKIQTHL